MATIGRSKHVVHKRMTEFSAKNKSTVKEVEKTKESVIKGLNKKISRIATKEEAKKIYHGVKAAATGKEARAIGKGISSFLGAWAKRVEKKQKAESASKRRYRKR